MEKRSNAAHDLVPAEEEPELNLSDILREVMNVISN